MNAVGVNKVTSKVFESQSFSKEKERIEIETKIQNDANEVGVEVNIVLMTNDELREFISN